LLYDLARNHRACPAHLEDVIRKLATLQKAAGEVGGLTEAISDSIDGDDDEWIALVVAARAFVILVDRLSILDRAQDTYHRASTHQGNDENRFRACLDETGRLLSEIEPGLDGLNACEGVKAELSH
jgi:hypothetical protein